MNDTPHIFSAGISNRTLYGITSEVERYSLILWCSVTLALSLAGNLIILVATLRYKCMKLDHVTLALIQNIAIADLIHAVSSMAPALVSLIADTWILGTPLCYITMHFMILSGIAAILLICALNISKLTTLLFPLRARIRSKRWGITISVWMWVLSAVFPVEFLAVDWHDVAFDYRFYRCKYMFTSSIWVWLTPLGTATLAVLPNIMVVGSTIWLVRFVTREYRHATVQGVVTVIIVTIVYFISYMPIGMYHTVIENIAGSFSGDVMNFLYFRFYRFAFFIVYVSNISNFFVYFQTIASFKAFIIKTFRLGTMGWSVAPLNSSSNTTTLKNARQSQNPDA